MTSLIKLNLKLIFQKKLFIFITIVASVGLGFLPGLLVKNANQALHAQLNETSSEKWKDNTKSAGLQTLRSFEVTHKNTVKNIRENIYNAYISTSLENIIEHSVDYFGNISFPYLLNITLKSTSNAIDQTGLILWALLATPFLLPFIGCFVGLLEKQNQIQTLIITSGVSKFSNVMAKIIVLLLFSFITTALSILGFMIGNGALSLPTISTNELLTFVVSVIFLGSFFIGVLSLFLSNLFKEPLTSYFLASSFLPLILLVSIAYGMGCNTMNKSLQTIKETALNTRIPREEISKTKHPSMTEASIYREAQLFALRINEDVVPSWVAKLNPGTFQPIHEKGMGFGFVFLALSLVFSLFCLGVINRK